MSSLTHTSNKQTNDGQPPSQTSRIGIIGAGVSGIAAAKELSSYNPIVFEATDSIGGVWKHCSFTSTKLQSPRHSFQFSDYPWPQSVNSDFPSHLEVLDYLHAYAIHFDVLKYVKFNSKVVEIRFVGQHETAATTPSLDEHGPLLTSNEYGTLLKGKPVWEVAVETSPSKMTQWYAFELLVVCIGKYGDVPMMPVFPQNKGPEVFQGRVLHSLDYSRLDEEGARALMRGKKVTIVGYKKSAIDLAVECAEVNQGPEGQPCTMVVRTLHWMLPGYRIWGLPFYLFYSIRASQFLHEKPNKTLLWTLLSPLLSPMRRAISMFIESYLLWKLPLVKYGLKPEHPFEEDYTSCQMAILPENFFSEAEKGKIQFKRARSKWWFWSRGIEFDDQTKLEADVVILATGFDSKRKLESLLPQPFSSLVVDSSGVMPFYRGTIHPAIPNMAFVGYVESVSNLQTAELRCKWLGELVRGKFKLPSIDAMVRYTSREVEVMRKSSRFYHRHCISSFSINHSDDMCRDMGWNPRRKASWLSEAFSPYTSRDYARHKN